MGVCSVKKCRYKSDKKYKKGCVQIHISSHKFPKDDSSLFQPWLHNIKSKGGNEKNWKPGKKCFVCSLHFKEDCFIQQNGRRRLKPDAVPTIFEDEDLKIDEIATEKRKLDDTFSSKQSSSRDVVPHLPLSASVYDQTSKSSLPSTSFQTTNECSLVHQQNGNHLVGMSNCANYSVSSTSHHQQLVNALPNVTTEKSNIVNETLKIFVVPSISTAQNQIVPGKNQNAEKLSDFIKIPSTLNASISSNVPEGEIQTKQDEFSGVTAHLIETMTSHQMEIETTRTLPNILKRKELGNSDEAEHNIFFSISKKVKLNEPIKSKNISQQISQPLGFNSSNSTRRIRPRKLPIKCKPDFSETPPSTSETLKLSSVPLCETVPDKTQNEVHSVPFLPRTEKLPLASKTLEPDESMESKSVPDQTQNDVKYLLEAEPSALNVQRIETVALSSVRSNIVGDSPHILKRNISVSYETTNVPSTTCLNELRDVDQEDDKIITDISERIQQFNIVDVSSVQSLENVTKDTNESSQQLSEYRKNHPLDFIPFDKISPVPSPSAIEFNHAISNVNQYRSTLSPITEIPSPPALSPRPPFDIEFGDVNAAEYMLSSPRSELQPGNVTIRNDEISLDIVPFNHNSTHTSSLCSPRSNDSASPSPLEIDNLCVPSPQFSVDSFFGYESDDYMEYAANKLFKCIRYFDLKTPIPEFLLRDMTGISNICEVLEKVNQVIADKIRNKQPLCSTHADENHSCEMISALTKYQSNEKDLRQMLCVFWGKLCHNSNQNVCRATVIHAKTALNNAIQNRHFNLLNDFGSVLLHVIKSPHVPLEEIIEFFKEQYDCLELNLKPDNNDLLENIQFQYAYNLILYQDYEALMFWCHSMLSNYSPDYFFIHFIKYCAIKIKKGNWVFEAAVIFSKCESLLFNTIRPERYNADRLVVSHYFLTHSLPETKETYFKGNEEQDFDGFEEKILTEHFPDNPSHIFCEIRKQLLKNNEPLCPEIEKNLLKLMTDRQTLDSAIELFKLGLNNGGHKDGLSFCTKALNRFKDSDIYIVRHIFKIPLDVMLHSDENDENESGDEYDYKLQNYLIGAIDVLKDREDLTQILLSYSEEYQVRYIKLWCRAYYVAETRLHRHIVNCVASIVVNHDLDDDTYSESVLYDVLIQYCSKQGKNISSKILAALIICSIKWSDASCLRFCGEQLQGRDDVSEVLNTVRESFISCYEFLSFCFFIYPSTSIQNYFENEYEYLIKCVDNRWDKTQHNILKFIIESLKRDTPLSTAYAVIGYMLTFSNSVFNVVSLQNVLEEPCGDIFTFLSKVEGAVGNSSFLLDIYRNLHHMMLSPPPEYTTKLAELVSSQDYTDTYEDFYILASQIQKFKFNTDIELYVYDALIKFLKIETLSEEQAEQICKLLQGDVKHILLEITPRIESEYFWRFVLHLFETSHSKYSQDEINLMTLKLLQQINGLEIEIEPRIMSILIAKLQDSDEFVTAFAQFSLQYLTQKNSTLFLKFLVNCNDFKIYFVKIYELIKSPDCKITIFSLIAFIYAYRNLTDFEFLREHIAKACILIISHLDEIFYKDDFYEVIVDKYIYSIFEMCYMSWSCKSNSKITSNSQIFSAFNKFCEWMYEYDDDEEYTADEKLMTIVGKMLNNENDINNENDMNVMLQICDNKFFYYFSLLYSKLDEPMKSSFITAWVNKADIKIVHRYPIEAGEMLNYYCEHNTTEINDKILSLVVNAVMIDETNRNATLLAKCFHLFFQDKERARQIIQTVGNDNLNRYNNKFIVSMLYRLYYGFGDAKMMSIYVFVYCFFNNPNRDYMFYKFDTIEIKQFFELLSELDNYDDINNYVHNKSYIYKTLTKLCEHKNEKFSETSWSKILERVDKEKILDVIIKLFGVGYNQVLLHCLINISGKFKCIFKNMIAKRCVTYINADVEICNRDLKKVQNLLNDCIACDEFSSADEKKHTDIALLLVNLKMDAMLYSSEESDNETTDNSEESDNETKTNKVTRSLNSGIGEATNVLELE